MVKRGLGAAGGRVVYIKLKRGKHGSIRDSFQDATDWIQRGVSVLFFPEGTRSLTSHVKPFKNGAFKLAAATKTAILPVAVTGTSEALGKGNWVFSHKVNAVVSILPAIEVAHEDEVNFAHLKEKASSVIQAELDRIESSSK